MQQQIVDAGLLGRSAILNIATGNGKTWLAGVAIREVLATGRRVVFLCPLRALTRELANTWSAWDEARSCGIGAFTGESGVDDGSGPLSPREVGLGIYTPERFDTFVRAWRTNLDWLAHVDLLVVDELHLLSEGRRGATLEGVIERFRAINPYARVLSLSATLGNVAELGEWLNADTFVSRERSIPVEWTIVSFQANGDAMKSKATLVADEAAATVSAGGQVIVFVQSRPRAQSIADFLCAQGLRAAAHHAGLPRAHRERVEAEFRAGELEVVVATPTLAQGVNLPARKVILHDLQRFENGCWVDLPVNEIWQLGGRAGRRGLDSRGEVVLLAPKHNQKAARRYLAGDFEAIRSQLGAGAHLHEQVLALIGTRVCRTLPQTVRTLGRSLYAKQDRHAAARIERAVSEMLAAGMLSEEDGMLRATPLGYVAVRHQLTPRTVIGWRAFADRMGDGASFLDILMLCAASPDCEARLRAVQDDLPALVNGLNAEPMATRAIPVGEWPVLFGQGNGRELVGAAKTALALRAWTRLGDIDEAAATLGEDAHAVEECRKAMVRMLTAFRAVVSIGREAGRLDDPDLAERLAALTAMVVTGLNEQHATLALLEGIGPKLSRRLLAAGIEDIEDLAASDPDTLAGIDGISRTRAAHWIDAAGELLGSGGAYRYREAARWGDALDHGPSTLDYFRWRRASVLDVAMDGAQWRVTGGADPHTVSSQGDVCDCADAARGHLCKHQIAVRHALKDVAIPRFDQPFAGDVEHGAGSLVNLWNRVQGVQP